MHDKDAFEDDDWISKSQLKREADDLKQLGRKLSQMNQAKLATIPMSDVLRDGISLAKRLKEKREALRRHYNYLGKLLRTEDLDAINAAIDKIENIHIYRAQAQAKLEKLRDQLINDGDEAINALLGEYPQLERQKLRQFVRLAKKELAQEKLGKAHQEMLDYLKYELNK